MRALAAVVVVLLLFPLAGADPHPNRGIPNACERSPPGEPCKFIRQPSQVIPETRVIAGDNKTYTGDWTHTGLLTVEGQVTFQDAQVLETNTSPGVVVKTGGTLNIVSSTFTNATGSLYKITAEPGSTVTFVDSATLGGAGVVIQTSAATIERNEFIGIPTALHLDGVTLTVSDNRFADNELAVLQTGGVPTLSNNVFENNYECVHDFRTDPTIVGNQFLHCIIGIWHEQSHSEIRGNYFLEDAEPPSTGIYVLDGHSPVIEDNVIEHFVNGIVLENARAFVRNNTIRNNTAEGILVINNSDEMDILGNVIENNGGDGIRLVDATNVSVRDNAIRANGGDGVLVSGTTAGVALRGNTASQNARDGFHAGSGVTFAGNTASANGNAGFNVTSAPGATFTDDRAVDNLGIGFHVRSSAGVVLTRLVANANLHGVVLESSAGQLSRVNASDNADTGFSIDSGDVVLGSRMDCGYAIGNGRYGVVNRNGLESATHGWYEGNPAAGVKTGESSLVDATNSYWGSASGPSALTNPTGTGDRAEGQVVFVPFLAANPEGRECPG